MDKHNPAIGIAKAQAKRVRREVTILLQMIAQLEDNLQPQEAQGNDQHQDH
jgi:low affinity Fe/Cu permease